MSKIKNKPKKKNVTFKFAPSTIDALREISRKHHIPYGPLVESAAMEVVNVWIKAKPMET